MKYGSEILSIIEGGLEGNEKKVRAYTELLMSKIPDGEHIKTAISNCLDGSYKDQPVLKAVNKKDAQLKIIVRLSDSKHAYEEDVTEEQREHFDECQSNGANPWLEKMTFEQYCRSIKETADSLLLLLNKKYNTKDNNSHFIYGWYDCFLQGRNVPQWVYNKELELTIEVKHVDQMRRHHDKV